MLSSLESSRSKRNRAKKHDERLPSQGHVTDPTSPRKNNSSPQSISTLGTGRGNMVLNDSSSGFRPSASHAPTTGPQKPNDGQHLGDGGISRVDAQDRAPRRQSDVHRSRPRPLIPAARMPNASVIENQQPRYSRRMSVNYVSTGRRATSHTYHSSFPYPMSGRSSNYQLEYPLPGKSGQQHLDQRFWHHEHASSGSRATRLGQPNGLAEIHLPAVNHSTNVTFSLPIPERVGPRTMHSNADSRPHVPSQIPGGCPHFHDVTGLNPPSMGLSQLYWSADVNSNLILSSTEPSTMPVPGSYSHQSQPASTQLGMNPALGMDFGQLCEQPGSFVASGGYQPENSFSGFLHSQPASSHISTEWQLQSPSQFSMPIQTLPQALTSQTDSGSQPPFVNSQPQYSTPLFQQTASNPGFPGQMDPLGYFFPHSGAPENDCQTIEHPAQVLSEENNGVGEFIVDVMGSFDHLV